MQYIIYFIFAFIISGCVGDGYIYKGGLRILDTGATNGFRPSVSYVLVQECFNEDGKILSPAKDQKDWDCSGEWKTTDKMYASQAGWGPATIGGATSALGMVGAGYFIGRGLERSGTTVNQSGGGANANAQGGSANQLQGQGQMQGQWQKLSNCQGNC